jgi:hypothetical protein
VLEINVSIKIKPYEKSNEELALLADGSYWLYRFFQSDWDATQGQPQLLGVSDLFQVYSNSTRIFRHTFVCMVCEA